VSVETVWRTFLASGACVSCGCRVAERAPDQALRVALERDLLITCPGCQSVTVRVERLEEIT
jgi:hypothetical protein